VASARHGDMQNRLPGLACATDAVSGLPHDDRLAWSVPEARVFSAAGAGRLPDNARFTSTAATAAARRRPLKAERSAIRALWSSAAGEVARLEAQVAR
jgi:hypothetical protein